MQIILKSININFVTVWQRNLVSELYSSHIIMKYYFLYVRNDNLFL